jgi:hypothetical protein
MEQEYRTMKIPTNLELIDRELDQLLLAASKLLYNDKDFQRPLQDMEGEAAAVPSTSPGPGR